MIKQLIFLMLKPYIYKFFIWVRRTFLQNRSAQDYVTIKKQVIDIYIPPLKGEINLFLSMLNKCIPSWSKSIQKSCSRYAKGKKW